MSTAGFLVKNGHPYFGVDDDDDGGYTLIPLLRPDVQIYTPITGFMASDVMSGTVTNWLNVWPGEVYVSMGRAKLETVGIVDTVIEIIYNGAVFDTFTIPEGQNYALWTPETGITVANGGNVIVRVASGSGVDLSVALLAFGFGMQLDEEED
jgi:hypothetical protein